MFKPSTPLSGGLLWKIPWRLSRPQKQRHRQRLRRVDNIVNILDTALKRSATTHTPQETTSPPAELPTHTSSQGKAPPSSLQTTAEGQRLLRHSQTPQSQLERRHGRGPKQGDYLLRSQTSTIPPDTPLLSTIAAQNNTTKLLERWKAEMPTEAEMLPRDKYTMFDKKVRGYRKGVHKLPKWTRVGQRVNPPGF